MGTKIITVIAIILIIISVFYFFGKNFGDITLIMKDKGVSEDKMLKEIDKEMMEMMEMMKEMTYSHSGNLEDVAGENSSGLAQANYADGEYDLFVTFKNLSDPSETDFYEGWIVRRGLRFDVLSTGKVERINGVYTNVYTSGENLIDHDFYVLTLEPDDGDPAPAKHILEGTLNK
jgi:uncharacterized protein YxeA